MNEEAHFKLLRLLGENPQATQREIARELGISLGKVNYCLQALIEIGHIKANNFKNSRNKAAYIYLLTPKGISAKAHITARYLQRRMDEFEDLRREIDELKAELNRAT